MFRLPEDSGRGAYSVSLADSFGNSLVTDRRRNSDGKLLRCHLDLRGFAEMMYILCIVKEGETPNYYSVILDKDTARRQ